MIMVMMMTVIMVMITDRGQPEPGHTEGTGGTGCGHAMGRRKCMM